ncbi:MAG TPA: 30S ribosomal protein S13 [Spirochaetota bacterium]|nr:30S ribosomal protein S13 [Spirochaetota bacterium]
MARIAGVDLPNKRVEIALTYIYGIGRSTANKILTELNIEKNRRADDLNDQEINNIRTHLEKNYIIEGDLKQQVRLAIKRLMDINSYRGIRHRKGLPVRGQRTKNNCRTRKGRGKTIANKKIATK